MRWDFYIWRKQWVNWLVLPIVILTAFIAYHSAVQQKQAQITQEVNRLFNEDSSLQETLRTLAKHRRVNHREIKIIRAQRQRLTRYAVAFKTNAKNLAQTRLAYEKGALNHVNLLTVQTKQTVALNVKRDQYLIAKQLRADEGTPQLSAGAFWLSVQNVFGIVFLLVLIVFSTVSLYTRDWSDNSWRLRYCLPQKRKQLLSNKNKLAGFIGFANLGYIFIVTGLVSGMSSHNFDGWRYPVLVEGRTLMTRGELSVLNLVLVLAWLGLLLAIIKGVGLMIHDRFVATFAIIALLVIGSTLFSSTQTGTWFVLNPFSQLGLMHSYSKLDYVGTLLKAVGIDILLVIAINLVTRQIVEKKLIIY